MRELVFKVNGQSLEKDPECSFDGLIAGSSNYLSCRIIFEDPEYDHLEKIIEFITRDNSEFFQIKEESINIPSWVTAKAYFKVRIHGVDLKKKTEIVTNTIYIQQEVG
jgi:hypothetical protein